ncbi:MAG: hypothetical protein GY820_27230 [Gammaproteobacteria bacterium]|nr:hypothetical protein [Gammaproteobacteria bacterium]
MSDELFEVTFSGEILVGENPEDVRVRVGKIFNADEAKIAQLFSGKRIVIKKNIDQQTAAKYRTALNKAGAGCEINALTPTEPASVVAPEAPVLPPPTPAQPVDYGDVAPPPQTDPLGITGDQIEDLSISIAPIGSALQDDIKQPEAAQIDISGIDVAPVGTDIGSTKKEPEPPPPDTSGLSMAD